MSTLTRYRIQFERIGRKRDLDTTLYAASADDLAGQIFGFAKKHLGSKWFDVTLSLDEHGAGDGFLEMGRFGRFQINPEPAPTAE